MNPRMKFLRRYIIGSTAPTPPQADLFTYVELSDTMLMTKSYIGSNNSPTVPNYYNGYDVVYVGPETFNNDTNVISVTISSGIEGIK
jgi:hypothetical protein